MMHFSSSLSTHESTLGGLRRSVEQLVADGTKCRAESNALRSELETAVQKLRATRDMLANEQCVRPNLRLERTRNGILQEKVDSLTKTYASIGETFVEAKRSVETVTAAVRKIESYGSASGVEFVQQTRNLLRRCVYRDVGVKSRIEQIVARLSAKTEAADDAERALAAANECVRALQSEVDQLETSLADRRAFAMNAVESRHAFARALAASAPMLRRDAAVDETELVRKMVTHRADMFAARTREMLAARMVALALAIPARAVEPKPLAAKPSTDAASALARFADDADVAAIVRERDEAREAATRAATATKTCAERMVRYLDAKNKGYLNAKKAEMRAAVDAKEEEARLERERAAERERDLRRQLEREREKTKMLESEREKLEKERAERDEAEAAERDRAKKRETTRARATDENPAPRAKRKAVDAAPKTVEKITRKGGRRKRSPVEKPGPSPTPASKRSDGLFGFDPFTFQFDSSCE